MGLLATLSVSLSLTPNEGRLVCYLISKPNVISALTDKDRQQVHLRPDLMSLVNILLTDFG